jgi:hypothetical protein
METEGRYGTVSNDEGTIEMMKRKPSYTKNYTGRRSIYISTKNCGGGWYE